MEGEAERNRLKEIEERRKVLAQGEREFKQGEGILNREEAELKKKMALEEKLEKENSKITGLEGSWNRLFGNKTDREKWTYVGYAAALILIIVLAIALRTTLTKYYGFYEPDNWYDFSVIRAAVNNNFVIPASLSLSGWPIHSPRGEPAWEYMTVLVPYFFLRFLGIGYYTIMRYISVVFGLLDMLGAYLLARFLSKDKLFLLLVIALVALSAGDAARTSALIFRGDSFVTFFLIMSLVFFVYVFRVQSRRSKIISSILSGMFLALSYSVWNGAAFGTVIYLVSVLLIEMVAFVKNKEDVLRDCGYVILSLFVSLVLITLLVAAGQIGPPIFSGVSFLIILLFLLISWYAGLYVLKKRYVEKQWGRIGALAVAMIIGVIAMIVLDPGLLYAITLGNGVIVTNAFSATIQELTAPTPSFLFASFGYAIYTTPMSIIMSLPAYLFSNIAAASLFRVIVDFAFWLLLIASAIPYLFMKVYDSGGFMKGNARWRLGADASLIVPIVYLAVTAFFQIYAIRFNSLIAVPLAIFGAYTIYWVILFTKRFEIVKVAGPVGVFAVSAMILSGVLGASGLSFAIAVSAGILIAALLAGFAYFAGSSTGKWEIAGYIIIAILIFGLLYWDLQFSSAVSPADSMSPQCRSAPCYSPFYSALSWLKNNSAPNSVVLTLWPDGSVVEGVANRTSIMDSVGSQGTTANGVDKSLIFANWILNSSDNPGVLTNRTSMDYPNYLVVRYVWLFGESVGIFQESSYNASLESRYAFAMLSSYNESANSTTKTFRFTNSPSGGGINAVAEIGPNNTLHSYINEGNGQVSPFSYVAFDNQNTGNFSVVRQTSFNVTNGQMLFIQYSSIPRPPLAVNVTNAMIFAQGLANSNLAKFLFFCNNYDCAWNNGAASLHLVYANSDTKIFKISYNSST